MNIITKSPSKPIRKKHQPQLAPTIYGAAVDHIWEIRDRALAGSRKDEALLTRFGMLGKRHASAAVVTWNYIHLAQSLRRQLDDQLAKLPGAPRQGQLFDDPRTPTTCL